MVRYQRVQSESALAFNALMGNRLAMIRDAYGYSQADVAEWMGWKTRTVLARLESGNASISLPVAFELCAIYGIPLLDLLNQEIEWPHYCRLTVAIHDIPF